MKPRSCSSSTYRLALGLVAIGLGACDSASSDAVALECGNRERALVLTVPERALVDGDVAQTTNLDLQLELGVGSHGQIATVESVMAASSWAIYCPGDTPEGQPVGCRSVLLQDMGGRPPTCQPNDTGVESSTERSVWLEPANLSLSSLKRKIAPELPQRDKQRLLSDRPFEPPLVRLVGPADGSTDPLQLSDVGARKQSGDEFNPLRKAMGHVRQGHTVRCTWHLGHLATSITRKDQSLLFFNRVELFVDVLSLSPPPPRSFVRLLSLRIAGQTPVDFGSYLEVPAQWIRLDRGAKAASLDIQISSLGTDECTGLVLPTRGLSGFVNDTVGFFSRVGSDWYAAIDAWIGRVFLVLFVASVVFLGIYWGLWLIRRIQAPKWVDDELEGMSGQKVAIRARQLMRQRKGRDSLVLTTLAVLVVSAPLLGLCGTIVGLVKAFNENSASLRIDSYQRQYLAESRLRLYESGSAGGETGRAELGQKLASAISFALITTLQGLLVMLLVSSVVQYGESHSYPKLARRWAMGRRGGG